MPARDDLEFESKRQQIIDGALEVFASKGFEKATNKDIADAAKIGSPGLIYHYFKDKQDLLRRVVEYHAPVLQLLIQNEAELMSQPPEVALTRFASVVLQTFENRTTVAILKLMLGEISRNPLLGRMVGTIGPGRGISFLTRYLEKQMEAGTMRRMDTAAAARCLIGPLIAFVLTREIFRLPDVQDMEYETMAETTVEVFLRGMLVPATHAVTEE